MIHGVLEVCVGSSGAYLYLSCSVVTTRDGPWTAVVVHLPSALWSGGAMARDGRWAGRCVFAAGLRLAAQGVQVGDMEVEEMGKPAPGTVRVARYSARTHMGKPSSRVVPPTKAQRAS